MRACKTPPWFSYKHPTRTTMKKKNVCFRRLFGGLVPPVFHTKRGSQGGFPPPWCPYINLMYDCPPLPGRATTGWCLLPPPGWDMIPVSGTHLTNEKASMRQRPYSIRSSCHPMHSFLPPPCCTLALHMLYVAMVSPWQGLEVVPQVTAPWVAEPRQWKPKQRPRHHGMPSAPWDNSPPGSFFMCPYRWSNGSESDTSINLFGVILNKYPSCHMELIASLKI